MTERVDRQTRDPRWATDAPTPSAARPSIVPTPVSRRGPVFELFRDPDAYGVNRTEPLERGVLVCDDRLLRTSLRHALSGRYRIVHETTVDDLPGLSTARADFVLAIYSGPEPIRFAGRVRGRADAPLLLLCDEPVAVRDENVRVLPVLNTSMEDVFSALASFDRPSAIDDDLRYAPITQRQAEILQLVANGRTSNEVAEVLQLKPKTVSNHLGESYKRLGASNAVQAILIAARMGLLHLEQQSS